MLEGLEVSESTFNELFENKDFRIDSQFYTQKPKLNPQLRYEKIGQHLKLSQYGVSIAMNDEDSGFPIYRMNEIHSMMCDLEVNKYAELTFADADIFTLNDRDVLFNRTNSFDLVGRTGLYRKIDSRDFVFASYLVRFVPDENVLLPEYMVAFLNSKQSISDIRRRARQSINQTNVNPEEVKEIEIPLLSKDIQNYIKRNFDSAHEARVQSHQIYAKAESILMQEVGLNGFAPDPNPINVKNFSESFAVSGRLDAEYYQKKYEQVIAKLKAQPHDELSNLVTISKSIEPGSAHYVEDGLPFLRVADYTKHGTTQPQKYLSSDFVKANKKLIDKLKPQKGTILFSKDGSVGTAYHLREDLDCITSGAILHLRVKNEKRLIPEYLTLALNSKLVQMQAERDAGGSIILHWRVSEIENVVVPVIDYAKQEKIAALVEESFALRQQSENLLEVAKRAVEIAIEQDETAALHYIRTNS